MKELKPNFTQIPNLVLDKYMSVLSGAELKVLLYICRRTYGFQKKSDSISITQIMNGITNSKGEVLDSGTGLSNRKVIDCINKLEELKIISTVKDKNKTTKFTILGEESSLVKVVKKVHGSSEESSPQVVKKVHTQKKEKESIQKKESEDTSQDPINKVIPLFKPLNKTGYKRWFGNTTQRKAVKHLLEDFTPEQLEKKIAYIVENRYQDEPYQFPSITTPLQFQEKHQNVLSWEVARKKHLTSK